MDQKYVLKNEERCDESGEYKNGEYDEEKEQKKQEEINGRVDNCRKIEIIEGGFDS